MGEMTGNVTSATIGNGQRENMKNSSFPPKQCIFPSIGSKYSINKPGGATPACIPHLTPQTGENMELFPSKHQLWLSVSLHRIYKYWEHSDLGFTHTLNI